VCSETWHCCKDVVDLFATNRRFFNQFTVTVRISRMSRVSVVVRFSFGDWIVIGLPDMQ